MTQPPYALLALAVLVVICILWMRWFDLSRRDPREERLRKLELSSAFYLSSERQKLLVGLGLLFVLLSFGAVASILR